MDTFSAISLVSTDFILDLFIITEKLILEINCSWCFWKHTYYNSQNYKNKGIQQNTNFTQKDKSISKTIANIICALFPFGSAWLLFFLFSFFNCLIIHLQALIYPPSSALYAQPLCETFSWISNELVAYKVFLPGKAPIYGHVCLFFISINPLGDERPYAVFWRTVPGTSLGMKSHCFG